MSLKINIAANYVSQIYVTLIGVLMVPMYIKYMGVEAYGLVGFFAMMQAWFAMLDMGLTPTISRETARYNGGISDSLTFRKLVRTLEYIFLFIAVLGGALIYAASDFIAVDWLNADSLTSVEIRKSIEYMGLAISFRWMSGLYRGVISGSEKMIWMAAFNAIFASFRFILIIPVLALIDAKPSTFFVYQLLMSFLEFAGLIMYAYRLMPRVSGAEIAKWDWNPIKPVLKFSMTIAFTSVAWVLLTQTDKLILSSILNLAEYGYFTLAILVAGSVTMISAPVGSAVMPRLARLEAENNHEGLIDVYRKTTRLVTLVAGSVAITITLCAEPLLWAWTGDVKLAHFSAPVLSLYTLGNAFLTVSAFPYYLQYAKGDLSLHLLGNILFVIFLVPLIIIGTNKFGVLGAGYAWLFMNIITFIFWIPFVHRKFDKKLNYKWYTQDVLSIFLPSLLLVLLYLNFVEFDNLSKFNNLVKVASVGFLSLLIGTFSFLLINVYGNKREIGLSR